MHMDPNLPGAVVREVRALRSFEPWCACAYIDTSVSFRLPAWAENDGPFRIDFAIGGPAWSGFLWIESANGILSPLVIIDSAPGDVWRRFDDQEIREHQTWIAARDRQGFRRALSVARALVGTAAEVRLDMDGVHIFAGQEHRRLDRWKWLRRAAPKSVSPMPKVAAERICTNRIIWGASR
ncbi:hypothetical protein [Rhodospirillum sp. A1_3_36]|uniref:hypothetical protein n=1 Tax=Rhodospirillum sp. A1_3_36 TaxID=3391666 RepID=UPI0039A7434C